MQRRNFFSAVTAGVVASISVPKILGAETDEPTYIKRDGTKVWFDEFGECHRVGGPAIIRTDGYQAWYKHGKCHRIGGPAVISICGIKYWYENNKLHRLDGPAIIYPDGDQAWYENGEWIRPRRVDNE